LAQLFLLIPSKRSMRHAANISLFLRGIVDARRVLLLPGRM
jgi:hypothetical protein